MSTHGRYRFKWSFIVIRRDWRDSSKNMLFTKCLQNCIGYGSRSFTDCQKSFFSQTYARVCHTLVHFDHYSVGQSRQSFLNTPTPNLLIFVIFRPKAPRPIFRFLGGNYECVQYESVDRLSPGRIAQIAITCQILLHTSRKILSEQNIRKSY